MTYAGMARRIGRPRAARAVGAAAAANPIPPLIPCHRLMGSGGGLRGYAGGIGMKMRLIGAEGLIEAEGLTGDERKPS